MPEQQQPPSIPGQLAVSTYLDGMQSRGELLPGAKAYLEKRFSCSNEHGGLKALVGFLAHEQGKRYLNPEREQGKPEAVLRAMARRFAGVLKKGEADELYNTFALDLADLAEREPGKAAERLWREMRSHEHRGRFLAQFRPPLDFRTAAVHEALRGLEHHVRPGVDLEELAHDWREIASRANHDRAAIMMAVAERLRSPWSADVTASGGPEEIDHAELVAAAAQGDAPASSLPPGMLEEFARTGGYDPM